MKGRLWAVALTGLLGTACFIHGFGHAPNFALPPGADEVLEVAIRNLGWPVYLGGGHPPVCLRVGMSREALGDPSDRLLDRTRDLGVPFRRWSSCRRVATSGIVILDRLTSTEAHVTWSIGLMDGTDGTLSLQRSSGAWVIVAHTHGWR